MDWVEGWISAIVQSFMGLFVSIIVGVGYILTVPLIPLWFFDSTKEIFFSIQRFIIGSFLKLGVISSFILGFMVGAITSPFVYLIAKLILHPMEKRCTLGNNNMRSMLIGVRKVLSMPLGMPREILVMLQQPQQPQVLPGLNYAENTHTASVHRSVSDSAKKLLARYSSMISGAGLDNTIRSLKNYVSSLPNTSEKHRAAKRCIARITAPDYVFTESGSQVTIKQLLALTFLAINDNEQRRGSPEDANKQLVEGLYEIQRGNNLSEAGDDDGIFQDYLICFSGAFNKLIEKLQGIHPDCEVHFVTGLTAGYKLPIVVREEAMRYLSQRASPQNVQDYLEARRLIEQVKQDGDVGVIWEQIKDHVHGCMFNEFESVNDLTGIVAGGQCVPFDSSSSSFHQLRQQIEDSPGFREYYRQGFYGLIFLSGSKSVSDFEEADSEIVSSEAAVVGRYPGFKV